MGQQDARRLVGAEMKQEYLDVVRLLVRAARSGVGLPKCSRIKSFRKSSLEHIMRTTQQFSITLPNEMASVVKMKVAAGDYATESEVIRDGLRALVARDRAVDRWLVQSVAPAYDALRADPARAVTIDQVRERLAAQHQAIA